MDIMFGVYRPLTSHQYGQICQIAQFKQNIRGKKSTWAKLFI